MPPVKQAQRDVAEVIAKLITAGVQDPLRRGEQIRFIVAAGDNFYMDGVKDVYDERFFTTFEGIYTEKEVRNVPWLVALGNHDHRGNWSAQVNYTYAVGDRDNYEDRWYMPHPYYAIKVSDDMVVVVIDTVLLHRCRERSRECWDGGKQKRVVEEWLLSTYASVRHKVVVGHFPVFSNGPHKDFPWFQSWLVPLMAKSCASIYIHADNHYLQLSKHGFQYYANSGGGGGLRLHSPRKLESWTQKESIFHAVEFGIMLHCKKGNRLMH